MDARSAEARRAMNKHREQLPLGLTGDKKTITGPEVNCSNCGAKFAAYYGYDKETIEIVDEQSCGLCHGETLRREAGGATI